MRAPEDAPRREMARVVIADATQPVSGLVYMAQARGLFAEEGLDVTLLPHTTGKAALAATLAGEADVATVAETPLVFAALKGERFSILATIATTERNIAVAARTDCGIECPEDLRGKRVGVAPGTNAEFFLETFLLTRRIRTNEVRIEALTPESIPQALADGRVEAAAVWHPHLGAVQRAMKERVRCFYDEQIYTWSWNLVSRRGWAETNGDAAQRLLRALARAEEAAAAEPEAARGIVAARCGMDAHDLGEMWSSYHFRLTLGQWLILSMESQAQWARRKGAGGGLPDFRATMFLPILESLRPEAVTVVR